MGSSGGPVSRRPRKLDVMPACAVRRERWMGGRKTHLIFRPGVSIILASPSSWWSRGPAVAAYRIRSPASRPLREPRLDFWYWRDGVRACRFLARSFGLKERKAEAHGTRRWPQRTWSPNDSAPRDPYLRESGSGDAGASSSAAHRQPAGERVLIRACDAP